MAKLILLSVGKFKNKKAQAWADEYAKRLSHYISFENVEVKDSTPLEESKKMEGLIKMGDQVILLDEHGVQLMSKGLATQLEKDISRGQRLVFIIGGAYGVSQELKAKAKRTWALSALTLPHELARVLCLEQLYRSFTILRGEKYHHE
jgi:23S rRNA (pseudouridine1915-N3)-methyltransferase